MQMRRLLIASATLWLACFSLSTAPPKEVARPAPVERSEYGIKVGDTIQVTVYLRPELSKTVVVDGKGRINLPRIHTVKASGLSAADLAMTIRQELQKQEKIANPQVTVCVGCTVQPGRGGEMRDVVEPSQIQARQQK